MDDKLNLERAAFLQLLFLRELRKRQMAQRPETDLPVVLHVAGCFGGCRPFLSTPEVASYEKPPP